MRGKYLDEAGYVIEALQSQYLVWNRHEAARALMLSTALTTASNA
jgi:hypothetical protein